MQFAAGKARAVSRLLARYADVGAVVDEMKLRKNKANLEQGGAASDIEIFPLCTDGFGDGAGNGFWNTESFQVPP